MFSPLWPLPLYFTLWNLLPLLTVPLFNLWTKTTSSFNIEDLLDRWYSSYLGSPCSSVQFQSPKSCPSSTRFTPAPKGPHTTGEILKRMAHWRFLHCLHTLAGTQFPFTDSLVLFLHRNNLRFHLASCILQSVSKNLGSNVPEKTGTNKKLFHLLQLAQGQWFANLAAESPENFYSPLPSPPLPLCTPFNCLK